MEAIGNLEQALWNPLYIFGNENPLLMINKETILQTWVVLFVLLVLLLIARYYLSRPDSILYYLIVSTTKSVKDAVTESMGSFVYQHFLLVTSIFVFILLCNWIAFIPWVEEPTKDLNTALALGFISFFYKEWQVIRTHGLMVYLDEFIQPIFVMAPLNVVGHFSKIISISFRLFGNIFGGSIITSLFHHAIAGSVIFQIIGIGFNLVILSYFTFFEGLIQAFVFTMLTLTYLSLALQHDQGA